MSFLSLTSTASAQPASLSAVSDLIATATGNAATITWHAPSSGTVARYEVNAYLGTLYGASYGTEVTTATSLTWDDLPFNQPLQFSVTPIGPDQSDGQSGPAGPVNYTGVVTPADSFCPASTTSDCVVVDTALSQGAETHPGSGLLHGTVAAGSSVVSALDLTHWRVSADDFTEYDEAAAYVPKTGVIEVLSDAWYNDTEASNGGYAADPWANWTTYKDFIEASVYYSEEAGESPYWEIQNEPENYPYSPSQPATRALVEDEYLYAYDAIKSVDPHANVVGPSIDWAYENASVPIDMKTFIPFAAAHGMKFAAIAWHENCCGTDSDPLTFEEMPQAVINEAQEVRELLAEYPGMGSPQLFVDENSSSSGQFSPGWEAGYLASENAAGITYAGRSCWAYPTNGDLTTDCGGPYLDQLVNLDGAPNASYWTVVDYAAMSGNADWAESSDPNLSTLAVTDSSGVTRLLVGRHQTCSGWTAGSSYCPVTTPPAPIPTTINVLVPDGATSATVAVQTIADTLADMTTAPATTTTTESVSKGDVTVSLPSLADGAAYFVTVTPNSASGTVPASGDETIGESPPASGNAIATRAIGESGDYQAASPLTDLGSPLTVLVTDQYGNPMPDVQVTYYVLGEGAFFPGLASNATVTTNSEGIATSPTLMAGLIAGYYTVAALVTSPGAASPYPAAYFGFWVT